MVSRLTIWILAIMLLAMPVNAYLIDVHDGVGSTASNWNGYDGIRFEASVDITIENITRDSDDTGSWLVLFNDTDKTVLENISWNGDNNITGLSIDILKDQEYMLVIAHSSVEDLAYQVTSTNEGVQGLVNLKESRVYQQGGNWENTSGHNTAIQDVFYVNATAAPPPSTNFSITATGMPNDVSLNTFNATVRNVTYQTTNGTIETNITSDIAELLEITVESTGFAWTTVSNWNASNNIEMNLTVLAYEAICVLSSDNTDVNQNYTVTRSRNIEPPFFYNQTHAKYNVNDSTWDWDFNNGSTSVETSDSSDFMDVIQVVCTLCTEYDCHEHNDTKATLPDITATINILDIYGSLISNTLINYVNISTNSTNNPDTQKLGQWIFGGQSTNTTLNITDNTNFNQNGLYYRLLTENTTEYNITLTPNQLTLLFYTGSNGSMVNGTWHDLNQTQNFENSTFILVQSSLEVGNVYVEFNSIGSDNHTQYYEYYNDLSTHVKEDIQILNSSDWFSYIKVVDVNNEPIEGAKIRVEAGYPDYWNSTSYVLTNQRLTEGDGIIPIYLDQRSFCRLTVSKTGYATSLILKDLGAEAYDSPSNPYIIRLSEGESNINTTDLLIPTDLWLNQSSYYFAYAMDSYSSIKVMTDYMASEGTAEATMTSYCTNKFCDITLLNGTHYDTTNGQINLTIVLDSTINRTFNITGRADNRTYIGSQTNWSGFDDDYKLILFWLMIIVVSVILGYAFQSDSVAIGTFLFGSLFLSMLHIQFIVLSALIAIKFGVDLLKRTYG